MILTVSLLSRDKREEALFIHVDCSLRVRTWRVRDLTIAIDVEFVENGLCHIFDRLFALLLCGHRRCILILRFHEHKKMSA